MLTTLERGRERKSREREEKG